MQEFYVDRSIIIDLHFLSLCRVNVTVTTTFSKNCLPWKQWNDKGYILFGSYIVLTMV